MSYLQLEIGGKLRGLEFNTLALRIFQRKFDPEEPATVPYALVWGGLKASAYVEDEKFLETFKTVCDWVDKLPIEKQTEVIKAFNETQEYQDLIKSVDKKKLTLKSTKTSALK